MNQDHSSTKTKNFPNEPKNKNHNDIRALFPGRFILRQGVAPNRFTCRHPRNANCSCHGAPPPPPKASRPTKPPIPGMETTVDLKAPDALQRIHDSYKRTLVQMLFAVRSFPDAAAAVQRILKAAPPDHQLQDQEPALQ